MVQRGEHFRFALKPREPIGIRRKRRREDLDRDLTFQSGVGGAIHLPHAALADLRGDVVDAKTFAGDEAQTAGSIAVSVAPDAVNPGDVAGLTLSNRKTRLRANNHLILVSAPSGGESSALRSPLDGSTR